MRVLLADAAAIVIPKLHAFDPSIFSWFSCQWHLLLFRQAHLSLAMKYASRPRPRCHNDSHPASVVINVPWIWDPKHFPAVGGENMPI